MHDQHDRTLAFVVEPAVEGVVEPFIGALPVGFGQCLFRLQRVVDDDVRTPSGQYAADRGGDATALRRRLEFGHRLVPRREASREDPPVPVADDDAPAVARQFVGEVLRITDAEDLGAGIAAQTPGRERNRRQQRLQMTGRQVDDQPPGRAVEHRRQLRGDDLDMRAERERGAPVELAKTAPREAREIAPQQPVIPVHGHRLAHLDFTTETRRHRGFFRELTVICSPRPRTSARIINILRVSVPLW
jgi:hypothetical protein